MKRVLITGGCGFIGINLVHYFHGVGDVELVVLDNLSLGRREALAPFQIEFIEGDVRDREAVDRAARGAWGIIHLAADTRVVDSIKNPSVNFDTNVRGTFCVLEAAREARIERVIFASTGGAIIGPAEPPVDEGMVPRPISPYGASKLAGEGYMCAYAGAYGMKTVSLRFSNVYGPRSYHKGSVVAQFCKDVLAGSPIKVFGDGSQTRDLVYVGDICKAIHLALTHEVSGQAYQLGSGKPTSINELLDYIRDAVEPRPMPPIERLAFRPGELRHTHSNIEKARAELGFTAAMPLGEGIANTWHWFEDAYPSR
jgi:UDP-glucose 4-epimerase